MLAGADDDRAKLTAAKVRRFEGRFASEVVLLTGFPSARAEALLRLLLEREPDAEFWLVVAPEHRSAGDRLLAEMVAPASRVRVIAGEPCAIDLGLSGRQYAELTQRIDRFFALYQTTDPRASSELSQRVNLGAAREIVELSRASAQLAHVTFLSSSSVFGDHQGAVSEEALVIGQRFRSRAEEALALAEALLRRRLADVPLSVVRTHQILGARTHVREPRATGLYLLLALVASAPKDAPLPLPPGTSRLVQALPADFVAEALYAASALGTRGHVYHFADPEPPTLLRVLQEAATHFGKRLEQRFDPRTLGRLLLTSPGFWLSPRSSRALSEWADGPSVLLTRGGDRLLERADLTTPSLLSYLPQVLRDAEALAREEQPEGTRPRTPAEAVS